MAYIQLNPIFLGLEKSIGNINFYHFNGKTLIRKKVKASNPRTEAQQKNRASFQEAVRAWQGLTASEKYLWNARAQALHRKGYHLFISEYLADSTCNNKSQCRDVLHCVPAYVQEKNI